MPRKGEAHNIRPQVCPATCDSRTDAYDRGRITEEPCARKSGTHGFEAEVEGAIPPSTVTGSISTSASAWRRWDAA
jgi:hypothetical protein